MRHQKIASSTSGYRPFQKWMLTVLVLGAIAALGALGLIRGETKGPGIGLEKPAVASNAPDHLTGSSEGSLRAWIKLLKLQPPFPNRDETVTAFMDWEPRGRPGTGVLYEWLVNDIPVQSGESSELHLGRFHSGDRVSVIAGVSGPDGSRLASERSSSVVIQNRPPILDGALEGFGPRDKDNKEWVGHIGFSDPDGDHVAVKLVNGPKGLTVEPDGTVRWPVEAVLPGKHELAVELEDERGMGFRGALSFSIEEAR